MKRRPPIERLALLSLAAVWLSACGSSARTVIKLGVPFEEPAPTVASAIETTLTEHHFKVEQVSYRSPEEILDAVLEGEITLGIVEEPALRRKQLQTVAPLYPSLLHVLYRPRTGVDSLEGLIQGRKIYAGPEGSTAWRLLRQLTGDYMISGQDFTVLDNPWSESPDVYFILGGLLAPENIKQLVEYKMYGFGAAEALGQGTVAEGLALRYPNIRPFILPAAIYGDLNPEPVLTLSTRTVLVSHERLPEETARTIFETLLGNAPEIAAGYSLVTEELNERLDPTRLALPLHAGSRSYLERDNPSFLERYADALALLVTLALTVASGIITVMRFRRSQRKERLDDYYRAITALRERIPESTGRTAREDLRKEIRATQEEVLKLAVEERIETGSTFVAFVQYSNQVLSEVAECYAHGPDGSG